MSFLKRSLQQYLVECGFTPQYGQSAEQAEAFFKNGKQVNIVDHTQNNGDDTCVNLYLIDKFAGKYTALAVLNESNILLTQFLKT